jgi:PPOX class probable F420-dependent enzyme
MAKRLDDYRDLFDKKAFAHLGTIRADGAAHVSPVWIDFDGTHVRFNTARGRAKAEHVARDPRVALSIQDPENP